MGAHIALQRGADTRALFLADRDETAGLVHARVSAISAAQRDQSLLRNSARADGRFVGSAMRRREPDQNSKDARKWKRSDRTMSPMRL
ncbi:hypothetical protein GCM10017056_46400 [Seohaeicola zhoushanensis]|uniref:Uncharacterized protein n=1 Tax=Seohaeicola zhoushanensis TaxID=1569283 RepID=A0A8J3MA00_9RHOB|nr:hypothetical protein GCM10017056_46400 [Seohaeicola zhoushanensis]